MVDSVTIAVKPLPQTRCRTNRCHSTRVVKPQFDRVGRDLGSITQFKLFHEMLVMRAHGQHADAKQSSDIAVAEAARYE